MQRPHLSPGKYLPMGFCLLAPLFLSGCKKPTPQQMQAEFAAKRAAFAEEFPAPLVQLPNPNGYDLLVQAAQSIQPGGEGTPDTRDKLSPAEDLQRQRAFTAKNAQALNLVRQGLQLPIMVPPARGAFIKQPPNGKIVKLARLMMQRNRVFAADGQWDKAINGALDVVNMGTSIQNGANGIGILVGGTIQRTGLKDLPLWVTNCDAKTAFATVKRMQKQEAQMAQFHSVMPETKWDGLEMLQFTLASPNWRDESGMSQLLRTPAERQRLKDFSESQIMRNYVTTMDKAITQSKLPYRRDIPGVPRAADPLSAYFANLYTDVVSNRETLRRSANWTRTFALHRLLQTAFVLQAFHQENKRYPQKLDELTGKYLPRVPRDPFAPDSPLIYQSDGKTFTLYSVGPDAVDSNGAPITSININSKSHGDIVFGFGVLNDGRAQNL